MRLFANIGDARDHILTAVLLLAAVGLMVTRKDDGLHRLRSASVVAISILEQPLSQIRIYRQALLTNRDLRRENILLQDEISRLRSAGEEVRELRRMLELRESPAFDYDLIPVDIVGKNLTGLHNSLTVNRGRADGLRPGMAVINSKGLIGRVILVGEDYSQVMPLTNALFRVSAMVQGTRAYGIVSWDGESVNELVLSYVPRAVVVTEGMVVETSGYSNQLPGHIPIGEIVRIIPEPGRETQRMYFRPFVNLGTVAEGFVVVNTPPAEIDSLLTEFESLF